MTTKKKKYTIGIIVLLIIFVVSTNMKDDGAQDLYESIQVVPSTLVQEVSVTGRVVPEDERDLAFKQSGAIGRVYVDVGDTVEVGDILMSMESSELTAQLAQSRATLIAEQALLNELQVGTRPEEIAVAQTAYDNAERALVDVQNKYTSTENKAEKDLTQVKDAAITALREAVEDSRDALVVLSDIQDVYFVDTSQDGYIIGSQKSLAISELFGVTNAAFWRPETVSELTSGLYADIQTVDSGEVDGALPFLDETISVLRLVRAALDSVPITATMSSADKSRLTTEKATISAHITLVSAKEQAVIVQEAQNSSVLTTAHAEITIATNNIGVAKSQLVLKQSGNTPEKVAAQVARVNVSLASINLIKTQIKLYTLSAPISGTVVTQEGKVGMVVSASEVVVTLISEDSLVVETYIPEADIAKVSLADNARITLDAYDDTDFEVVVSNIDPSETVIEGVPTYKVELTFLNSSDLILPGMTANIEVMTDQREDVLAVPLRAVVIESGERFVRVIQPDGSAKLVLVTTGIKGSDGRIEIVEGLNSGDNVVTFINQ